MHYIIYQGRKQGPLSNDQLKTLITRGKIGRDTPISRDEENWTPLGKMEAFAPLLPPEPEPVAAVEKIVEPTVSEPQSLGEIYDIYSFDTASASSGIPLDLVVPVAVPVLAKKKTPPTPEQELKMATEDLKEALVRFIAALWQHPKFFSIAAISSLVTVTFVALLLGIILGTSCSPTTR